MPMPVSLTTTSTCELTRSSRTCTLPPRLVNFTPFERRFHSTCCRRSGSPEIGPAFGSSDRFDANALGVGRRGNGVDGILDDLRQVDGLHVQSDLAGDDPGHVQHVVDDLRQRDGVSLDRLDGLVSLVRRHEAGAHDVGVAEDRIQRRPQLM